MMLYEFAIYRAGRILYLQTSGVRSDQAEVALKWRPDPIFLIVSRGDVPIVQSNLETRGVVT